MARVKLIVRDDSIREGHKDCYMKVGVIGGRDGMIAIATHKHDDPYMAQKPTQNISMTVEQFKDLLKILADVL